MIGTVGETETIRRHGNAVTFCCSVKQRSLVFYTDSKAT